MDIIKCILQNLFLEIGQISVFKLNYVLNKDYTFQKTTTTI